MEAARVAAVLATYQVLQQCRNYCCSTAVVVVLAVVAFVIVLVGSVIPKTSTIQISLLGNRELDDCCVLVLIDFLYT